MKTSFVTETAEVAELMRQREEMVERQIRARGIRDERILNAMRFVPRHEFVPHAALARAYEDGPLSIGEGQTISQPFMVAAIAEAAQLNGTERVLEVGTGCGYQAAVLARLAKSVDTVEFIPALARGAEGRFVALGYTNIRVHVGDGSLGLPERAPFDAIVVTAAAPRIPPPLIEQLAEGGRLVIPVGTYQNQELLRARKTGSNLRQESLHYCRFVPLVGRHGWPGSTNS